MSRSLCHLLALALLCPLMAFGQKDTASIIGTVTDHTGATVPGAAIDAVSLETNFTYHATSNQAGEWTISPVRIGTYA
jgi:Carboxypeptidase regulatory-like domain